MQPPLMTIK